MKTNELYQGDYIQGKFQKVTEPNGEIVSRNPGNLDSPVVKFPFRFEHAVDAVAAAKRGFQAWRRMPLSDRCSALMRYRDVMAKKTETLAHLISAEVGKPLWESKQEVSDCLRFIEDYLREGPRLTADIEIAEAAEGSKARVRFVPRGVMVAFSAVDLPAFGSHRFVMPSLVHGNSVVLKSAKYAPQVAQFLALCAHEAGLPAGVFNLVHGDSELGRRLVTHPDVDGIMFVGSHESGSKILKQIASDYRKTLVMRTGSKNGTLIWQDCQYDKALYETFCSTYVTTGQRSTGTKRIFVHESLFDRFISDFHELGKQCPVGYGIAPTGEDPFMGPLISEKSVENYLRYQGIAVREGCEEVMRGKHIERKQRGFYVSPSIHIVVAPNPKSVYETSETFGPNAAIYKVSDLDEAADLMNQTQYGMVASVYTADRRTFMRIAEEVKVGCTQWNLPTIFTSYRIPVVGLKKSGNARPMGSFAGYQCTSPVTAIEPTTDSQEPLVLGPLPRLGQ